MIPTWLQGMKRFVWVLFAIDVALGLAYLANYFAGQPWHTLTRIIDLDGEANLPTWWSSIQWFAVAALLFAFVLPRIKRGDVRSWALLLLPLVFLLFSMDEVVQIHESVGLHSDVLLPGGTRSDTVLPETGLFFLVVGVPFLLLFTGLIIIIRPYLHEPPGAFKKLVVGMVLMMTGAIGVDWLANFVVDGSTPAILLIYIEETLEMVGATIILWGSYELVANPL